MGTDFDFYNRLNMDERQLCDFCRDWNLGKCEKCEFISRYVSNKKQEDKIIDSKKKRRTKSKVQ